jgi:quercetin dioxygenase-like cupin family protein
MTPRAVLYRWDELPLEKVTEMVARKVISGAETTLAQAYFKKGALVPLHAHPAEVFIYVLQGAIRLHVGSQDVTAREGDVIVLPPDAAHQAETLDDTFVLTVTPAERSDRRSDGVRS